MKNDDGKTILALTGTDTTRTQSFLEVEYASLSNKEKDDITKAEGAEWWSPIDSSVGYHPFQDNAIEHELMGCTLGLAGVN